jgi:tRNA dimethylallyltransferase
MESANLGNRRRRIVALLGGATGSGKTRLALEIAQAKGWEILSADSGQSRAGLAIGTAAPGPTDLERVPHHLVGDLTPDAEDSVALYLDRAERVMSLPGPDLLAVGGTNQFLQALRDGLPAVPAPDPVLRKELSERLGTRGKDSLWNELAALETPPPDAKTNPVRLIRALEKAILARRGVKGRSRPALAPGASVFALAVNRSELHSRLEARLARMLESGWREEVRALAQRFPDTAPCWKCIGYRTLRGALDVPDLPIGTIRSILEETRQYAKRQETWLRNRLDPRWVRADGGPEAVLGEFAASLETIP